MNTEYEEDEEMEIERNVDICFVCHNEIEPGDEYDMGEGHLICGGCDGASDWIRDANADYDAGIRQGLR